MKPVYLSFKGLNSFSERAEIDFTKLTQSGIFGIFGDTGSGKSTILDGINFALYGDIGRSKEKIDVINYKCDSVEVKFTFNVLENGERKNYTVERSIKRKSGVHKACLYEEKNGESLCVADSSSTVTQKIVEIIGVDANDFRKCIALPQGEFAEFVSSRTADRIKLIERLFNLSKYGEGLKNKLRELEQSTENSYNKLNGEMSVYAETTQERIDGICENLKQLNNKFITLENDKQTAEKSFNTAKTLYSEKTRLDEARGNLLKLKNASAEMDKLKQNLKLLPDCKRVADEDKNVCSWENRVAEENDRLTRLNEDIKKAQLDLQKAQTALEQLNYEERLAELSKQSAQLFSAKEKFENLEQIRSKLKQTQTEFEQLSAQKKEQEDKLATYRQKLESLKSEFGRIPEYKIEDILSPEVKTAIARGAYLGEFNFICELRENIKEYRNDTKLFKFVTDELTQRINYLEEIVRSSASSKTDVNLKIKEFEENYELREKYSKRISNGEKTVATCENELKITEEKLRQKTDESKERSQSFQQILAELSNTYGSKPNYEKISRELQEQKDKLAAERTKLQNGLDGYKTRLTAITEEKKNCIKYIELLQNNIADRRKIIAEILTNSGIDSTQSCKKLIDEFGDYESARKKSEEYDAAVAANSDVVCKLAAIEGIDKIDQTEVKRLEDQNRAIETSIRETNAEIKVNESNLNALRKNFEKKRELAKELDGVNETRNLVGQLKVLLRDNNFMKYIADGHLGEISKIASKTLLELTDGRYFLVYRDGFFVGDNFNGGNERGVNTLSGGETFLVSLSLALALSSVICARSNKNIEFFFLDEGFGTLDETLIEVVMNALEKLKNSHFTIGIISHVEELKHRIESKIIVNKATESHGSTLTLVC